METNRSWSIDDRRYQFQFSTEIGWEIQRWKKVRMLKNPSYSGITTEFLEFLRRIWQTWLLDALGHAQLRKKASPCRPWGRPMVLRRRAFRNVRIGTAFSNQ